MAAGIEGILETALYVDNLEEAEHFYAGLLGLDVIIHQPGRHLFLRCGSGVLLLFNPVETVKPAEPGSLPVPAHGATGPGHVCFRMDGAAMDAMVDRLRTHNIAIEADFRWPNGARSIYFRDPAGNSLECAEARLWQIE